MSSSAASLVTHVFSVDVEEYFHVNGFEHLVDRSTWSDYPTRVEVGMDHILDLLARHGASGTFFTLGWVAERHPSVVRRIVDAGHELASHGYLHRRVLTESPSSFREDVRRSKALLEDISGLPVTGYRAPSFSIIKETEWALDVLVEEGFHYDSSRFPITRPGYGSPHVALDAHVTTTPAGAIYEVPLTVLRVGSARIPAAGGGWFRQFPLTLTARAFAQRTKAVKPGMFYIHPWELDPDQPRIPVGLLTRIRHYRGLSDARRRLDALMTDFQFGSVASVHGDAIAAMLSTAHAP